MARNYCSFHSIPPKKLSFRKRIYMKYRTKFLMIVMVFVLLGVFAVPLYAQDEGGQGGIIIEPNANANADVATMNPLLQNDVYSSEVNGLLFPTLIGIDPETGVFAPGARA